MSQTAAEVQREAPEAPESAATDDSGRSGVVVRDTRGMFAPGTAGGPGAMPNTSQRRFNTLLQAHVKDQDLLAAVDELIKRAKAGEAWAVRELLDRTCGRARLTEDEAGGDTGARAVLFVDSACLAAIRGNGH